MPATADSHRLPVPPANLEPVRGKHTKQSLHSRMPSASLSSSDELSDSCPSLSASYSTSSERLTETDNETPPRSPDIGPDDAWACAAPLDSMARLVPVKATDSEAGVEADAITPRPKLAERRSYFPQPIKGEDTGYEAEREAWPIGKATRARCQERGKAATGTGGHTTLPGQSQCQPLAQRRRGERDRMVPQDAQNGYFPYPVSMSKSSSASGSLAQSYRPMRIDIPAPSGFEQRTRVTKQHATIGLGLELTTKSDSHNLPTGRPRLLGEQHPLPTLDRSSNTSPRKKPRLHPVDTLTRPMNTPSPMDALPPSLFPSGLRGIRVEEVKRSAQLGGLTQAAGPHYTVRSLIGLGLYLDPASSGSSDRVSSVDVVSKSSTSNGTGTLGLGSADNDSCKKNEDNFNPYFAVVDILRRS